MKVQLQIPRSSNITYSYKLSRRYRTVESYLSDTNDAKAEDGIRFRGFARASCVAFSARLSIYINKQIRQWGRVDLGEGEGGAAVMYSTLFVWLIMRVQIAGVHKYQILTSLAIKINSKWPTNCARAVGRFNSQSPLALLDWRIRSSVYLHFPLRNGSPHLCQSWAGTLPVGRRWLITPGAHVATVRGRVIYLFYRFHVPCSLQSGAQYSHLFPSLTLSLLIKGNARLSHFITNSFGQCRPKQLPHWFFLSKKTSIKTILNISNICLRCDDISPADETIKKSC